MGYKLPGITSVENNTPIHSDLAPNFSWGEATKNGTRLKGLTDTHVRNIIELAIELQKLRDYIAKESGKKVTFIVTSWYRDPDTNRAVGGATRSQHLKGKAADIILWLDGKSVPSRVLQGYARSFGWKGGLGINSRFTHLDLGSKREFTY